MNKRNHSHVLLRKIKIEDLDAIVSLFKETVHLILGQGKYLVENVANSDLFPPIGSYILIAPLLISGGTEAPVRLIGFIK